MRRANQKIQSSHLTRSAYLYVRHAVFLQGSDNDESTQRHAALKQRAMALGWPAEKVVVIDSDIGESGASSSSRKGFQRLLREVSLGRAGIVMALDMARLGRNGSDCSRLLEMCRQTDTLILFEDGIYDLADVNDKLLLGLKEIINRGCDCRRRRRQPSKSA